MKTPVDIPSPAHLVSPMLAKPVASVPEPDAVPGGYSYEPKWDGFRAIVYFDGTDVEIGSRGSKMLTRYFPELVAALHQNLAEPCVLDGEIVLRAQVEGGERLDWEALSQRIHPAESRIAKLSVETPASFVAFDLLAIGNESLLDEPLAQRRERLEKLLASPKAPVHLSQVSRDPAIAERWLREFEGAGLDGVIAKPLQAPYAPGKRTMLKIKHERTADAVVTGYRIHASGVGVGSLLLGLYDRNGELQPVGGASAFSDARRRELIDELAPYVERDDAGEIVRGAGERNRFSASKDTSFVKLVPALVVEVKYDQMEGARFRHTVQFRRWRPDRDPETCTFAQLEVPVAYDLNKVLL
ncbi:MAG: ATP-dependent ligase [Glaciihabitans sp.]|nr:ATP-dependent ligase [Glaciihabitans sp.]